MSTNNDDARHEAPDSSELAGGLSALREQAGLPATEDEALKARVVKTKLPIDDIIGKIVGFLKSGEYEIYRRGNEIGTVDQKSGEWRVMTARRFRSWLPMNCGILPVERFQKDESADGTPIWRPIKGELTLDQAATILESDELRVKLPVIESIHKVKLPVWREALDERDSEKRKGFRKLELLQHGYDPETLTYTLRGGIDYDEGQDPNEGLKFLKHLLEYFPWADRRSLAVQVAGMMTIFCAKLFRGRSPMFLWNANLPGSGKSRLAELCLTPVHGSAARAGFSYEDKAEVKKELDAAAQAFAPYIFFDDLQRGKIRNEHLQRWLTAPDWSCRVLGSKELWKGRLYAATLMTGNEVKVNDDLERRTLVVDLFARVSARERVLPNDTITLDDEFFADENRMAQVLAAMWGLMKWWDENERPKTSDKPLDSFEGWSRVVPAVVECAGFGNALAPFDAPDAGNTEAREMERLVKLVIKELMPTRPTSMPADEPHVHEITLQQVVGVARRNGLFQEILWTTDAVLESEGDKGGFRAKKAADFEPDGEDLRSQAELWMNPSMRSKWGKMFKGRAASGRYWKAENGEVFEVGSRASSDLAKIRLVRLAQKA